VNEQKLFPLGNN